MHIYEMENLTEAQIVKRYFLSPFAIDYETPNKEEKNIYLENHTGPHCL